MKIISISAALLACLILSGCALPTFLRDLFSPEKPLETVANVDLEKYSGVWYSIESFPTWFEKGCTGTRAEYSLKENGRIRVINQCRRDNQWKKSEGEAWPINEGDNSKLYVSFRKPFKGKYYIIDLAEDYSYALIGHPNRQYLWILARKSNIETDIITKLKNSAELHGFDISRLRTVKHEP